MWPLEIIAWLGRVGVAIGNNSLVGEGGYGQR